MQVYNVALTQEHIQAIRNQFEGRNALLQYQDTHALKYTN